LLTPGNTELRETSGTRNFLSLTSCCLCRWRRPAQPGDGLFNAYLLSLATASATWRRPSRPRPRIFYLWRRAAQLGDGPRNLLTPSNTESMISESSNVHLSATNPHYQVEIVGLLIPNVACCRPDPCSDSRDPNIVCHSLPPHLPVSTLPSRLRSCLSFFFLKEMRVLMCVMSTAHVNCVVCDELCVRTCNSKV